MPQPPHYAWGEHPFLESRHFAASFLIVVTALFWSRVEWGGFSSLFGCFLWVAPISYALYAFHVPLTYGHYFDWISPTWLRVATSILITVLLAYLAEVPMQKALVRWLNPLLKRLQPQR